MSQDHAFPPPPAEVGDFRLAVVAARYNAAMVDTLCQKVLAYWERCGVLSTQVVVERVSGSQEIPFGAHALLRSARFDAVVGLGVVIAGDTSHHEVIAIGTAQAIHEVARRHGVPVINGILTVNNVDQALDRLGRVVDRGAEFAAAALEMAEFSRRRAGKGNS